MHRENRKFFCTASVASLRRVVEAISFYHWLFDLLENRVETLILANPVETKKYSWDQPTTDCRDAKKVAILLSGREFQRNKSLACFVPDKSLRTFRELIRHRDNFVRHHTSLVNSAHKILLKNNLKDLKILSGTLWSCFLLVSKKSFLYIIKTILYKYWKTFFIMKNRLNKRNKK
jgi:hypothetical protein